MNLVVEKKKRVGVVTSTLYVNITSIQENSIKHMQDSRRWEGQFKKVLNAYSNEKHYISRYSKMYLDILNSKLTW